MLEKNCRFLPLKQKLGWLKHHYNDMGELMAALVEYADSDSMKDPESDDEKLGMGRRVAMQKDNITRRVKVVMVNVRRTAV